MAKTIRLTLLFGLSGPIRTVNWWKELEDFPKLLNFNGSKWEWVLYEVDNTRYTDYTLTFGQLATYDPNFYATMPSYEELFGGDLTCDCGARFTTFPFDHMFFCKLWKPWDKS